MTMYTTPIDRPGLYLTRNGKQVRIDAINRSTNSSWTCEGHILRVDRIGRTYRKWNTWQPNGVFRVLVGSGLDIVGYISA